MKQQRYTEAAIAFQQALKIRPEAVQTENNLKVAQARLAQQ
jgi:cytochrome c-type biogenesis protein CcmH/NrfG